MEFEFKHSGTKATLSLSGDCLLYEPSSDVARLSDAIKKSAVTTITVRDAGIGRWDSSLLVVLYDLIKAFPDIQIQTHHLPTGIHRLIQLAFTVPPKVVPPAPKSLPFLEKLGDTYLSFQAAFLKGYSFITDVCSSLKRWIKGRAITRPVDFWFALEDCAPKAVSITSLISLMVGLILAFVGAIQLKSFGAQIYVASLVCISMTRIMGAIMVGIIMAGRTGASYAATIGTMQVNEELDALKTMGISRTDFLVLPRLLSLVLSMPFLVTLADIMGIVGGGAVSILMLDITPEEYWLYTVDSFNMTNFLIGLFHGFVFGFVIAFCGCYYGLNTGRDADSVGVSTTRAVVSSIVWMIVMTGIITLICEVIGV